MRVLRNVRPVVVLLLLALAFASAISADADKPIRDVFPTPDGDYPAALCGFPVHRHVVSSNEYYTDFGGDPILWLVTGCVVDELTNVDTGKTITLSLCGPGKLYIYGDGSIQADTYGNSLFDLPVGGFPQYPRLLVSSGRVHIAWDSAGTLVDFNLKGHARDMCAELSD